MSSDCIPAADDNANPLTVAWLVAAGEESRGGSAGTGFADDAEHVPQRALRRANRIIRHQHDLGHVIAGDREDLRADLFGCQ
jgi:hypothetical protein